MAVETVIGKIELSADKPLRPWRFPFEDGVPLFEPVEFLGGAGPEFFRLLDRLFVERLVFGKAFEMSIAGKIRRTFEPALLVEGGIDVGLMIGCVGHGSSGCAMEASGMILLWRR